MNVTYIIRRYCWIYSRYSLDNNNIFTLEEIKQNLLAFGGLQTESDVSYNYRFTKYLEEVGHETNVTNILYKVNKHLSI